MAITRTTANVGPSQNLGERDERYEINSNSGIDRPQSPVHVRAHHAQQQQSPELRVSRTGFALGGRSLHLRLSSIGAPRGYPLRGGLADAAKMHRFPAARRHGIRLLLVRMRAVRGRTSSLRGRVIAEPPVGSELRQTPRWLDLNEDAVIAAVALLVAR